MTSIGTVFPSFAIPPLENGDRLTRAEFEHRYNAIPDIKKAELIEGVVYMASPLRFRSHSKPHAQIIVWLGTYEVATLGVELGDTATVRLDADNEPQPDALLRIAVGGRSRISDDCHYATDDSSRTRSDKLPAIWATLVRSSVSIQISSQLNNH